MKSATLALIVFGAAVLFTTSCGGTGGGTITPPPGATLTLIAVTAATPTVIVGNTDQMVATGTFSDGSTKNLTAYVTWSSSSMSIATVTTTGGLVTGVAAGSASIAAALTGVTGNMTITVNPLTAISSIAPAVFRCDAECPPMREVMLGSGFQTGDTINTAPNANLLSEQLVNAGEADLMTGLDTPHASPGSFTFTECRGGTTTCSNPWSVAFTGNQNDLVIGSDGELYNLDRVAGEIWKFKSDGTPDGAINTGPLSGEVSIAFDAVNNLIWVNQYGSGSAYGFSVATGSLVAGSTAGNLISDSGVESGVYCGTGNATGNFACFVANGAQLPVAYTPAGTEPWSVTMLTLNPGTQSQETDAFVYDREGTALYDFIVTLPSGATVPVITLKPLSTNPLILNGITPADMLANTGNGGWYLVRFATGPAAGMMAFLSAYDNTLVFVNASTMTETKRVTLNLPTQPASGTSFRIAADETNGRVIVALANVGASTSTSFLSVTPAGVIAPLTTTAQNIIAVGLGVSSDGSRVYACMRDQCVVVPNQLRQPLPNP